MKDSNPGPVSPIRPSFKRVEYLGPDEKAETAISERIML